MAFVPPNSNKGIFLLCEFCDGQPGFSCCIRIKFCNCVLTKAVDVTELPHTWTGSEHEEELQI